MDDEGDPSSRSLNLKVGIETTDTREAISVTALVDSGATGCFIDRNYVKANRLTTWMLSVPIPVHNVDGTPNEAHAITEVVDLILRYENHSECTLFAVTELGNQDLILRHAWLKKHNPEINWVTGEVKMSRCSAQCCSGCRDEIREECRIWKAEIRSVAACTAGDLPDLLRDDDDEPEFEEGDHIFATGLKGPMEEV